MTMRSCFNHFGNWLTCRFTNDEDKGWYENAITNIVKTEMGEEAVAELYDEPYFVDFLREAPEPTGEEADDAVLEAPKVYELVRFKIWDH